MSNFLPVNKLKNFLFILSLFIGGFSAFSQQAVDFGLGANISTGLQDEWGVHLKSQYHLNEKWNLYGEYNLFFRRDVIAQNTETYHAFGLGANYQIFQVSTANIYAGLGYVANNFPIDERNPDTTELFVSTGNINHAANLKLMGILPLGEHLHLFAEYNIRSFGKRYDTFTFGFIYRLSE